MRNRLTGQSKLSSLIEFENERDAKLCLGWTQKKCIIENQRISIRPLSDTQKRDRKNPFWVDVDNISGTMFQLEREKKKDANKGK
eukprot:Awhi_evm1s11634